MLWAQCFDHFRGPAAFCRPCLNVSRTRFRQEWPRSQQRGRELLGNLLPWMELCNSFAIDSGTLILVSGQAVGPGPGVKPSEHLHAPVRATGWSSPAAVLTRSWAGHKPDQASVWSICWIDAGMEGHCICQLRSTGSTTALESASPWSVERLVVACLGKDVAGCSDMTGAAVVCCHMSGSNSS